MDPMPSASHDNLIISPYFEWVAGLSVIVLVPGQRRTACEAVVLGVHTPVVDGVADKANTMLVVAWESDGLIGGRTLPAKACRLDLFNDGNRGHLVALARKAWRDRWLSTARTPTGKWVVMFGSPLLSTTAVTSDHAKRGPFIDEDEQFALALCIIAAPELPA